MSNEIQDEIEENRFSSDRVLRNSDCNNKQIISSKIVIRHLQISLTLPVIIAKYLLYNYSSIKSGRKEKESYI